MIMHAYQLISNVFSFFFSDKGLTAGFHLLLYIRSTVVSSELDIKCFMKEYSGKE